MGLLDPALKTALEGRRVLFFGAVEIALPGGTVRLLDGSAEIRIAGDLYVGRDQALGVLESVKGLGDALGDSSATVTLGLLPPSTAALADLLDPAIQGSAVTIMVGALDVATGTPIGMYTLFTGEADVPTVEWDTGSRRIDLTVNGIGERLFATEEGIRLSDAFHQSIWPGERGLAFATGIEGWVAWGQDVDTTSVTIRTNNTSIGLITHART